LAADAIHRKENLNVQVSYQHEYIEEETPGSGLIYPVEAPGSFKKSSTSNTNRALFYLVVVSAACLTALVLAPVPVVQGAAAAIWLGSLKIAQRMLSTPAKKKKKLK
jgi:hypothetical protein